MDSTKVNFSWNPAHGIYDVAIEAQTILNEGDITNNIGAKIITER